MQNPVIECLEYWLDQAKSGELVSMGVAFVKAGDQIVYDYAGVTALEETLLLPIKNLTYELEGNVDSRKLGPRNYELGANFFEYHLSGPTPINWDFLIWLIDAEMTRRRLKGPPPLRIAFTHQEKLDRVSRDFFENVFRPLLPLVGAVEDEAAKGGRHKTLYVPIDLVNRCRAGEEVPILKASPRSQETMASWLHGTKPITITMREAEHWPWRNSNLEAWLKFANDLQKKGEDVIFIRDTSKANEPLPGFCSCPIAAFNVDLRMALYEQAKTNLCISNGPCGLCLFSDVPYLYFVNIQKNDKRYAANNTEWWYKSNGIGEGEQWPWAKPKQHMIWKRDTYENICEAWEQFEG